MALGSLIDGTSLARSLTSELAKKIKKHVKERPPGLATVLVGHDPASIIYVQRKREKASKLGIASSHIELSERILENELLDIIRGLNHDPLVDGILVQLPLPKHISQQRIIEAISPEKDVDGFHPLNLGRLLREEPAVVACTPKACLHILDSINCQLVGAHVVMVGRSNIVGKPFAHLMMMENATVTVTHSLTRDLKSHTKMADVLVSAAGVPNLITKDHVKPGAVVIDVGINRLKDHSIVGDVDFDNVREIASHITPVPGGVGPLTIAMLMENTWELYEQHLERKTA